MSRQGHSSLKDPSSQEMFPRTGRKQISLVFSKRERRGNQGITVQPVSPGFMEGERKKIQKNISTDIKDKSGWE